MKTLPEGRKSKGEGKRVTVAELQEKVLVLEYKMDKMTEKMDRMTEKIDLLLDFSVPQGMEAIFTYAFRYHTTDF